MPGPRYVSELQANALWVCLSCLWAACAFLAWLTTAWLTLAWGTVASNGAASSLPAWGSQLTLVALGVAVTAFVLRLPILSMPPRTSLASDHAVWLLSTCASVNWLGFLALQVPTWSDLIPPLLMMGAGEVWFHALVIRTSALPWLRQYCLVAEVAKTFDAPVAEVAKTLDAPVAEVAKTSDAPTPSAETLDEFREVGEPSAGELPPLDAERDDGIERKAVAGVDEQGKRYLSGEIKVSLAAQQSTQTLSIAFSPPFVGEPDVDFECEGAEEDVAVQLIHNTPSGMRLGLRRAASTEATVFWLQWYAVEVELSQSRDASRPSIGTALP